MNTNNILDLPVEIINAITLKIDEPKAFGNILLVHRVFINSINKKELKLKKKNFYRLVQEYKKDKKIIYRLNFKGLKEGKYKVFRNDELKKVCKYKHGLKEGVSRAWYLGSERELKQKYYFQNDELHGKFIRWFPNGKIEETCCYDNGIMHGKHTRWFADGNIQELCYYENDKLHGKYKGWYEADSDQQYMNYWVISYKNGVLHGKSKTWYNDGQIHYFSKYFEGIRTEYKVWNKPEENMIDSGMD